MMWRACRYLTTWRTFCTTSSSHRRHPSLTPPHWPRPLNIVSVSGPSATPLDTFDLSSMFPSLLLATAQSPSLPVCRSYYRWMWWWWCRVMFNTSCYIGLNHWPKSMGKWLHSKFLSSPFLVFYSFSSRPGCTSGLISTKIAGSLNVLSAKDFAFWGPDDHILGFRPQNRNFGGVNRHFKPNQQKNSNPHSLSSKLCIILA